MVTPEHSPKKRQRVRSYPTPDDPMCQHVPTSIPPPAIIYKDECTRCFANQDSPEGLDICLGCLSAFCPSTHARLHQQKSSHHVFLNVRRFTLQRPQNIDGNKLRIENQGPEYTYETCGRCYECGTVQIPSEICERILNATSAATTSEIASWELEVVPCSHAENLTQQVQGDGRVVSRSCVDCSLEQNLWMCLTCGNVACGRKQYGSNLGGEGHALKHYADKGHPLAVKLGTITPDGKADIYCYSCDDQRVDPHLGAHLRHFGMNVEDQRKTEKSLVELQIEQNTKFDFSMTTDDGRDYTPLSGPGYVGMNNLGNSCYLASAMQCLMHLDELIQRYDRDLRGHVEKCAREDRPAECYECQMHKLASGLWSDRFSQLRGESQAQTGISPFMFRDLISRNNREFRTMRQQDASEFLQYFSSEAEKAEKNLGFSDAPAASDLMKFKMRTRLKCGGCSRWRVTDLTHEGPVLLPLPPHVTKDTEAGVSINECLGMQFALREVDFNCPHCQRKTIALVDSGFLTYPVVLALSVGRFIIDNWVPAKTNVSIEIPVQNFELRSHASRALPPDAEILPDDKDDQTKAQDEPVDADMLMMLESMGFPRIRCEKALRATKTDDIGFSIEAASNWIFEHMDDPDVDLPVQDKAPKKDYGEQVVSLTAMGFSEAHASRALEATEGCMERAVEWIFSHPDTGDSQGPEAPGSSPAGKDLSVEDQSTFNMHSFISHKGTSIHAGHYVCHVWDAANQRWTLFNDNRVVIDPKPDIGRGYLFMYRRSDSQCP